MSDIQSYIRQIIRNLLNQLPAGIHVRDGILFGLSFPTTLYGDGLFKIINGQIHRVYTVLFSEPYSMKQVF
jgi:hypothetical protein